MNVRMWNIAFQDEDGWVAYAGGAMTDGLPSEAAALEWVAQQLAALVERYQAHFGDLP